MKQFIYIPVLLLCLFGTARAGVWSSTWQHTEAFVKNPHTAKYGFYAFWIFGRGFCDALVDAHRWDQIGGGNGTRIINNENWHIWKNARDFSTIVAGAFLGGAYAAGYIDAKGALKRFLFGSALAYPTWRNNYTYARWGNWWDTSRAHNEHIFVYPGPDLKDHYVPMSGAGVTTFYSALYFAGIRGAVAFDPAEKRTR